MVRPPPRRSAALRPATCASSLARAWPLALAAALSVLLVASYRLAAGGGRAPASQGTATSVLARPVVGAEGEGSGGARRFEGSGVRVDARTALEKGTRAWHVVSCGAQLWRRPGSAWDTCSGCGSVWSDSCGISIDRQCSGWKPKALGMWQAASVVENTWVRRQSFCLDSIPPFVLHRRNKALGWALRCAFLASLSTPSPPPLAALSWPHTHAYTPRSRPWGCAQ